MNQTLQAVICYALTNEMRWVKSVCDVWMPTIHVCAVHLMGPDVAVS